MSNKNDKPNIVKPNVLKLKIEIDTNLLTEKKANDAETTADKPDKPKNENETDSEKYETQKIDFTANKLYNPTNQNTFSGDLLFSKDAEYGSGTKVSEQLNNLVYEKRVGFFTDNKSFNEIYRKYGTKNGERLPVDDNNAVVERVQNNIMNTLQKVFPTKYPFLNTIEDTLGTNSIASFTFKSLLPPFIGQYLYTIPNNYYSYMKINGKVYTIANVLWLNTFKTHPIYREFMRKHMQFIEWKQIASANIPKEIGKSKDVFKKIIVDEIEKIKKSPLKEFIFTHDIAKKIKEIKSISNDAENKIIYFGKKQSMNITDLENKKITEKTFFTLKEIHDLANNKIYSSDRTQLDTLIRMKNSMVEQIILFNTNFHHFNENKNDETKKNKYFEQITINSKEIFLLYETLESYIRSIVGNKINILKRALGSIMTLLKIREYYLDNEFLSPNIDNDVKEFLTTGLYSNYSDYLNEVKKISAPVLVSMNTDLQLIIDDYSKGLKTMKEFEEIFDAKNNESLKNVLVSFIGGKEYKIFVQMDFIGGEINDKTEIDNCYYRDNLLEYEGRNLTKYDGDEININRYRYYLDMDGHMKQKKEKKEKKGQKEKTEQKDKNEKNEKNDQTKGGKTKKNHHKKSKRKTKKM